MIYETEEGNVLPVGNVLWLQYAAQCIQWRITMLERTSFWRPPPAKREQRIHALEQEIRLGMLASNWSAGEHWTDALAFWQQQPADARGVIVQAVARKLATIPEALGVVRVPQRLVFLPNTAAALANAVADVARDSHVIWRFRFEYLGEDAPETSQMLTWRIAAFSLAALLNRKEHFCPNDRQKRTWFAERIAAEPDIPELPLVPSL